MSSNLFSIMSSMYDLHDMITNSNFHDLVNESMDELVESVMDELVESTLDTRILDMFESLMTEGLEDIAIVLTPREFDLLNTIPFIDYKNTQNAFTHTECMICQDPFTSRILVTQLSCSHTFCTSCIRNWLQEYKCVCPICKSDQRQQVTKTSESASESVSASEL